jgi:hypothetical protein
MAGLKRSARRSSIGKTWFAIASLVKSSCSSYSFSGCFAARLSAWLKSWATL